MQFRLHDLLEMPLRERLEFIQHALESRFQDVAQAKEAARHSLPAPAKNWHSNTRFHAPSCGARASHLITNALTQKF